MESKRVLNKKKKQTVENKDVQSVEQQKEVKKTTIDFASLPSDVNIKAIQTTKHLEKGKVYKCGKNTAAILIEKGVAELV